MKCMLVCMLACVHLSHFYINLYISFICEYIFTRFAENVHGCENMSVKDFGILKFMGVSQLKPMHGFSPYFQDMFNLRGSRAD